MEPYEIHPFFSQKKMEEIIGRFSDIVMEDAENGVIHSHYRHEQRELESIRNGSPEQLLRCWQEAMDGNIGVLAKDRLRNLKNFAVVLITLGSRAAIDGGVHPEIAYSLSDSYIQHVEERTDPLEAIQVGKAAQYHYALLVRDRNKKVGREKENIDPRIDQCKNYIFRHMHEKICISDIAGSLFMNANYLSNLFKQKEGISIERYIWQEKLKMVKNLLIYSQYSSSEIASYMGFCSQSHLNCRFKKSTGYTLQQYRRKFGLSEYQER